MLKGNRKYIITLVLCFGALILLQLLSPKPINWNPSYLKKDKIPYGTSALNEALPVFFPNQIIETKTQPLFNTLLDEKRSNCNYIFINASFEPDKLDTRELLRFVSNGNNAFVAASYFSGLWVDTLKLKTDRYFDYKHALQKDSTGHNSIYNPNDTVKINFVNPLLHSATPYVFSKGMANTYFSSFDTTRTTILGNNSNGKINFIRVRFGKGYFYISPLPEAFSNYHFTPASTNDYVAKAFSYLPVTTVLWDEYYKAGNVHHDSPLRVIFSNPALLTAYYLLLVSLILFMIIGIKRKQRPIPVVEPLRNTTLEFVEIVGTLYYQTKNHKNIADKKITYFLEYIRSSFQVKTTIYDDAFIERIANLSGIAQPQIHELFYYFSEVSFKTTITQQELIRLNTLIEEFYKNNKR